jgi:hypothetical protein
MISYQFQPEGPINILYRQEFGFAAGDRAEGKKLP